MKPLLPVATAISLLASSYALSSPVEITVWRHQASNAETKASEKAISRLNAAQNQYHFVQELIPAGSYTQTITAAAKSDGLPCIIDIDQPLVPNFAWNGFLSPLESMMSKDRLAQINASGKGTYKGKIYSVGQFDVALTLLTRKSLLKKINARQPDTAHPWSKDELMEVLDKIKQTGEYRYPFDILALYTDEWVPYGWSPMMISWGADLINRDNYIEADGYLNSDEAIEFAEWMYSLVEEDYTDRKPTDDKGLITGRVAIQYTGSWAVGDAANALGDDLAILPVPDFGNGPSIGGGSWHWGATSSCKHPQAATVFLDHMTSPFEIAEMSKSTSLIPTSDAAAQITENYKTGGKWRTFYEFSSQYARLRPETPAYAVISSAYSKAMQDVLDGKDPADALDVAVDSIESAIEKNNGYGFELK
ncbi:extracellular solute-binding protein [Vibrio sp. JC009]|uniref:extracellular solute-binding protein n=1 Tax=Vibrio sp. JC009 TaxID=2912314 RepID=UPI0023B00895|nr:extracellular solute-binding protein [Vibrio sp. JC009]WED24629.1 extracellular solute-binding protein [Vibrio sp. JC009]